jgi:hypothetical protein
MRNGEGSGSKGRGGEGRGVMCMRCVGCMEGNKCRVSCGNLGVTTGVGLCCVLYRDCSNMI